MSDNSYIKKIEQLLYNYKPINFSSVNNLEFVKGLNFESESYKHLADNIKKAGPDALRLLSAEKKGIEDLSVYKFSDQTGKLYLVTIYDSDDLWQDPEILDIFCY